MKTVSFKTRARTVDHLGREQIADVPTAISELWKNAYDAYARKVSLTIFDEDPMIVTIADDGHGMSVDELIDRWLIVGTESKLFGDARSDKDRDGLALRTRQGQKGIGRLSSAHLGPLMLMVSKRQDQKLAAVLIDWRLFENPFLILSDVEVPVVELDDLQEIEQFLPLMVEALLENILGANQDDERSNRLRAAWASYDHATAQDAKGPGITPPSAIIISDCRLFKLESRYLEPWGVWTGSSSKGTVMVVSGANEEFSALLPSNADLITAQNDKERFVTTLGGFVDPLYDPARPDINATAVDFEYSVLVASGDKLVSVVGTDNEFNRAFTDRMEHIVDGRIDENGVFRGQIKAFGEWRKLGDQYEIRPPKEFIVPVTRGSLLGPVDVYLSTFEQDLDKTTHTPQELEYLKNRCSQNAGLMIYRNGLRVLPYGRVDNDFFEIEFRRSKHAGRHYWNARRMYGRIAISRENNPNLKDKAGREGFIVNKAAKTLKTLIINILQSAANDYLGGSSDLRKEKLPELKRNYEEAKAKEAQAKLRQKQRKTFRSNLKARLVSLPMVAEEVRASISTTSIDVADDIAVAQERLEEAQARIAEMRLPGAPSPLGTLEDDYRAYRRSMAELNQLVSDFANDVAVASDRINPQSSADIVLKQIQRNESQLTSRTKKWAKEIGSLQDSERARIESLVGERNKLFREETAHLIDLAASDRISVSGASKAIGEAKSRIDAENELLFENYKSALENMRDSIDIQAVAILSGDENAELRGEVDRLNGLAQLGITVEFLDHELHSHDAVINSGLKRLRNKLAHDETLDQIETGYQGLKQILDFLGPLRMAGRPQPRNMSGEYIFQYVAQFFERAITSSEIEFSATEAFKRFTAYDQPSRLLPVFVNLVNNSLYWLVNSRTPEPRIIFDVRDGEVVVADNGPGVDEIDVKRLFTLLFTRKVDGGRGVGLYLSQANLAAGGHTIRYEQDGDKKLLSGANFVLKFRGATFDE